MMPLLSGTGSQLDSLLPASAAAARPPEADVKAARVLAANIPVANVTPEAINTFRASISNQAHNQLEALAFVLNEEYPNRISDQIKKVFTERLVALRSEVTAQIPSTQEALKAIEDRLEWVRRLLTLPSPVATTVAPPVQPVVAPPSAVTDFVSGLTTRVMTMFSGHPPTPQQAAAIQTQTSSLTSNLAEASERIIDTVIASPETLSRIPLIGSALAAPINLIGGLMGINPANRAERIERRQAERLLRTALAARGVVCPNMTIDSVTLAVLKGQVAIPGAPPPAGSTAPVNIIQLLDNWIATQRPAGAPIAQQLVLNSVAELAPTNVDTLNKQIQAKRVVDGRTALVDSIGKRLRRTVTSLTNGAEVQMQSSGGSIALIARIGDANLVPPPLPGAPVGTPLAPVGIRDFDDTGALVSPEAKTLAGAMIKFPRATKIRIVATGTPEMTSANELTLPVGSFDEAGVAVSNEAKTLVGMSVKFPTATKLRLAAAGGNYEMINLTEFTGVTNGFSETGSPSTPDARQFDNAIRTLTGATKITIQPRGNAEILNQTEFNIPARSTTRIADLQALANLVSDERVQQITINTGMQREGPLLAWRDNGTIEINAHDNSVARIVAAGGWSSILNRISVGRSINLQTMAPISSSSI